MRLRVRARVRDKDGIRVRVRVSIRNRVSVRVIAFSIIFVVFGVEQWTVSSLLDLAFFGM